MTAKIIRVVAIIMLALTAVIALMGGIGSTCLAFRTQAYAAEDPTKWGPLVPFAWLYQILVFVTLAAAVYAVYATWQMLRAHPGAYRHAVLATLACLAVAAVQMFASRALRGASQPNDMRVYFSLLTLGVLALFQIPGIKHGLPGASKDGGSGMAAGVSLFLAGVCALSVPMWAGSSHMVLGVNYADAFHTPMFILGGLLLLASGPFFWKALQSSPTQEATLRSEAHII
jgi:hypothetical protein